MSRKFKFNNIGQKLHPTTAEQREVEHFTADSTDIRFYEKVLGYAQSF